MNGTTSFPIPTARIGTTHVGDLLNPTVVLPSQTEATGTHWSGERRLALAVLEDAIATLFRNLRISGNKKARLEILEVDRWIDSPSTLSPFSFENVCTACFLDPEYLRAGIKECRSRPMDRLKRTREL